MEYVFCFFFILQPFYLEMVLQLSTGGNFGSHFTLYQLLFSCVYGSLIFLLGSLLKKSTINKTVRQVLLILTAIPFLVSYFVFNKFKVFYDLNTMLGGAGGALGDFSGDITRMIFSGNGMFHILLFLLPSILYAVFGWRFDQAARVSSKKLLIFLGGGCLCYLLTLGVIYQSETDRAAYTDQFHYETAVEELGLLSSIRITVRNAITGQSNRLTFETDTREVMTAETQSKTTMLLPIPSAPIIYGENKQDIDFDALAAGASEEVAALDKYVASIPASSKNEYTGLFQGKNLIFITAEAFSSEVIDEERTPTLFRLAHKGIEFTDYYQPSSAGTTGGEYSNICGMLPSASGKSMKNTANTLNYLTMGYQLNLLGYFGKAYHNNDYTFYDRNLTHNNLGYSEGFVGMGNGLEEKITAQWPRSDLELMQVTMPEYLQHQPFNIYYMTVSGHSLYDYDKNAMTRKHWEEYKDLPYAEPVKCYLACQQELEVAMTYLVEELEKAGIADDTVICLAADHFPYGLDEDYASGNLPNLTELYGYEITNYLERDHSSLIIWSGCLEDREPITVEDPVFSPDILPTLLNLFGVDFDSRLLPGRDVFSDAQPLMYNLGYDWKTDLGTYYSKTGTFVQKEEGTIIPEGYVKEIRKLVQNKVTYSKGVLSEDYYRHIYGR